MSALFCPECPTVNPLFSSSDSASNLDAVKGGNTEVSGNGTVPSLPLRIAHFVEEIRQDRIRQYAQEVKAGSIHTPTALEQHVDELLASLHDLHRLEQLAAYVVHGGQVAVQSDRLLVNEYADTFEALLALREEEKQTGPLRLSLLPRAQPEPLD